MTAFDGRSEAGRPPGHGQAEGRALQNDHGEGRPSGRPFTVLIADTDGAIRQTLRQHLELAGFAVTDTGDSLTILRHLDAHPFAVVIIDDRLPGIDALTLCRTVRRRGPNRAAVIVLLSTRASEADAVAGLSSGADDFVTKPFGVRELMARIAARLRRFDRDDGAATDPPDDLIVDVVRREVQVRGQRIAVTRQEFEVLVTLAERRGSVHTRASLLRTVWRDDGTASERTVDVAISRLRRKIEINPHAPRLLVTAWGVGYRLAMPE